MNKAMARRAGVAMCMNGSPDHDTLMAYIATTILQIPTTRINNGPIWKALCQKLSWGIKYQSLKAMYKQIKNDEFIEINKIKAVKDTILS